MILLCLAVVVINPHTWRMWLYPFQTVGIGALRDFIQEWQSPDFHLVHVYPFVIMLMLLIVALGRAARPADWTDLTLIALWTGWSLFAGRNIALFGLIITPVLVRYADVVWTQQWQAWGYPQPPFATAGVHRRPLLPLLNWAILALIIGAALFKISLPLSPQANLQAEQSSQPYGAVEFIKAEQPPSPLFNSYNWGGYLIFKLWPEYSVYIDGRTDLYDDAFIRRYLSVTLAEEGWEEILAEDSINTVLVEHNSPLARFLGQDMGWHMVYQDEMAVVFVRKAVLP
jgi:hypothetical protein